MIRESYVTRLRYTAKPAADRIKKEEWGRDAPVGLVRDVFLNSRRVRHSGLRWAETKRAQVLYCDTVDINTTFLSSPP